MTYEDDAAHDERPAAGIAAAGASRAGEQRLQREFGRVPNGLVMISLDTGPPNLCLAVNDAYCELTGYSPRELDGRDFLGDIHPEDQPALETLIQDVRSGAVSLIRADARLAGSCHPPGDFQPLSSPSEDSAARSSNWRT